MTNLAEARARQNAARDRHMTIASEHIASYARAVDARRPAHELAARRRLFTAACERMIAVEARAFAGARLP